MKVLKSIFALLIVASLFTACGEEEYIKPDVEISDVQSGDRPRTPIPTPG